MDFLAKVSQIIMISLVIYLWNKFIITTLIKKVVNFYKKNNANNLNKQPIKFIVNNELIIIKYAQYFYWFGCLLISIGILLN